MSIQFTGKNIEVTDALRELMSKKIEKLKKHIHINQISVVFSVEKRDQIVSANVQAEDGFEFNGTGKSEDMYESIDKLIKVLDQQAMKHKAKINDRKHQPKNPDALVGDQPEADEMVEVER